MALLKVRLRKGGVVMIKNFNAVESDAQYFLVLYRQDSSRLIKIFDSQNVEHEIPMLEIIPESWVGGLRRLNGM